jgi:dynein heavy chain
MEIGMVLFDNGALKERIRFSAANCLSELFKFMPEHVFERAIKFT